MTKRCFDVVFSLFCLVILAPILIITGIFIKLDSKGPVFFIQVRVGKNNKDFKIYKFRTMFIGAQTEGLLTLGNRDARVTKMGYFLRKYKIDEFPQLFNVLMGNMSVVGPRPELRHYVNFYKNDDYVIFSVKPGITGLSSIKYRNEAELLKKVDDPETFYINTVMPDKLKCDKEYLERQNFLLDLKIISATFIKIFRI